MLLKMNQRCFPGPNPHWENWGIDRLPNWFALKEPDHLLSNPTLFKRCKNQCHQLQEYVDIGGHSLLFSLPSKATCSQLNNEICVLSTYMRPLKPFPKSFFFSKLSNNVAHWRIYKKFKLILLPCEVKYAHCVILHQCKGSLKQSLHVYVVQYIALKYRQ